MRTFNAITLLVAVGACLYSFSCSDHVRVGQDFPLSSAAAAGTSGDGMAGTLDLGGASGASASGGSSGNAPSCRVTACQGKVYLCGNCLDDDADGLVDSADPECTGPCDNTEDSYNGGIPGGNNAPCREDCYFDQDTGSGNDHCYWSQDCDPLSVAPDYPPSADMRCAYNPATQIPGTSSTCAELQTTQDPRCLSYCGALTPNGCDSFGCCELPAGSGEFIWIGSTQQNVGSCNENTLGDPAACHPCTPVTATFNSCEPCEVCVGRPTPAPSCASSGTSRCPSGLAACGQPNEPACGSDEYCLTGCCQAAPK